MDRLADTAVAEYARNAQDPSSELDDWGENSYLHPQGDTTVVIHVERYPQLKLLCWNRAPDAVLDGDEALVLYERNWRFVDVEALTNEERALIEELVARYGNGVFHV